MKLLRLTRRAVNEAAEAAEYLTLQNPVLGPAFKLALAHAFGEIATKPKRHAKLETNRTDREIRRVILHRFRYLVIYEVIRDAPIVLSVMHASRRPDYWQSAESDD